MEKKTSNGIRGKMNDFAFVMQFAVDDFKSKYAGSALGALWAFLQPIITIVMYWFVFQMGFRSAPVKNFPFILWLMAGLVPWFFISEAISNALPCMMEYSYLVKKVLFNIDILPIAKIISVMLVQFVLIVFTSIVYCLWGYYPDSFYLQLPVYLVYMFLFIAGIVYLTATLYVFFKDVAQIVSVVLQFIFWMTPIVWDFGAMPEVIQGILKYNPLYYVICGYRNIFIYKETQYFTPSMTLYYWLVAIVVLVIGRKLFNKCKTHFADVL